jgi:hypothetical protein
MDGQTELYGYGIRTFITFITVLATLIAWYACGFGFCLYFGPSAPPELYSVLPIVLVIEHFGAYILSLHTRSSSVGGN